MESWHLWSVIASLSDDTTNSAVNGNLAFVIINHNNSSY